MTKYLLVRMLNKHEVKTLDVRFRERVKSVIKEVLS